MNHHPKQHPSLCSQFFTTALAIGMCIGTSGAATIVLNDTLDNESNFHELAIPGFQEARAIATIDSSGGGSTFTAGFSTLGETVLSYTWQAPSGKKFVVTPPTGASSAGVTLEYRGGINGTFPGTYTDNSPLVEFIGGSGSLSVRSALISLTGPGSGSRQFQFSVSFDVLAGQSFSFESATITTTIPDSFATDFSTTSTTSQLAGTASGVAPQGQWISLENIEAIPEPSTSLLLALSLSALAMRRRRP